LIKVSQKKSFEMNSTCLKGIDEQSKIMLKDEQIRSVEKLLNEENE